MSTALLRTKLSVPQLRPSLVPRRRLVDRLDTGLETGRGTFNRKLTLVSAPAGFGKTTLVAEWLSMLNEENSITHTPAHPYTRSQIAWVSLDEGDDDPALFWAYVIAALQKVQPGVGHDALKLLRVAQSPPVTAILTDLLNELAGLEASTILVLDDYHAVEARPIHEGLAFVLDNLPFNVHLVIASRADPALPLARLRAHGELLEVREADLRFTPEEATFFLNQVMDLKLSAEDVAALEERTEGWIAGLQLWQLFPESIPELYSRASQWFEDNGFQFEAIDHAFEAGDDERAAYLIEKSILQFFRSGEVPLMTVRAWLDSLPDELVRSRPRLGLTAAWSSLWAGQPDAAETRLGQVERLLTEGSAGESAGLERRHLGELAAVRANIAFMRREIQDMAHQAQRALDMLPSDESFLRSISYNALGQAFRLDGQPLAAGRPYARSAAIGRAEHIITTGLLAMGYLVQVKAMQGQLRQAQAAFREALDFAGQMGVSTLPALGVAYVSIGDVLREWNDLESAEAKLRQGIELCQQWQALLVTILDGYMSLARVYQAGGNGPGALEAIDQAIRLAERYDLPQSLAQIRACQVWLWLAQGHDKAVRDWAKQVEKHTSRKLIFAREPEERMLARVLILQGRAGEAMDLLSPLLGVAESAGRTADVIQIRALHALAHQAVGDESGALATLERALQLAEPQGFVRAFVDEGLAMEKLLRQAASRGLALDYVNHLLEAFRQVPSPMPPAMAGGQPPAQPLPNPLTKREHEVLRLIAAGLTNREIAEELVVVLGTVKAHINSIYRKLDVSNRVQAVSRARELRLL